MRNFLKLVEIKTKLASIFPFLVGTIYALYRYNNFHMLQAVLFFAAMILFDMTTTAMNNYRDYVSAHTTTGYGYEVHNILGAGKISPLYAKICIIVMLIASVILGLLLVNYTNPVVLLVGIVCFGIGICYSFGPIPISRTPFGELFSGLTMGFMIPFLAVYIHTYDQDILTFALSSGHFMIQIDLIELILIFMVSLPLVTAIANIMLANNLCDMDEDLINHRYTLPIYFISGKEKA